MVMCAMETRRREGGWVWGGDGFVIVSREGEEGLAEATLILI